MRRRTNKDRPARPEPRRCYRLTAKGLQALREAARRVRPWLASTGPKTAAGKVRASGNARKHGERSAEAMAQRREAAALFRMMRTMERDPNSEGPAAGGSINI